MWKSNLHRERQSRDTKAQPGQTNWTFWNRTFRSRDSKVVHRLVKEEQGTRNTYLASPRETRCCTLLKPCRSWLGGQPRISCREHLYIFVASFFFVLFYCPIWIWFLNAYYKAYLALLLSSNGKNGQVPMQIPLSGSMADRSDRCKWTILLSKGPPALIHL